MKSRKGLVFINNLTLKSLEIVIFLFPFFKIMRAYKPKEIHYVIRWYKEQGYTRKEIQEKTGISFSTIKYHLLSKNN